MMTAMATELKLQRVSRITSFDEDERSGPRLRYWLSPSAGRADSRPSSLFGRRSMEVAPDLNEFIACLTAHAVEFVIVGAYALAYHGAPRVTGNLDVLVSPTVQALEALEAFGFPATGLTAEAVVDKRRMIEMGVPPVQIHVMSAISGVDWPEVCRDLVHGALGSRTVSYIGRDTLIRNKRSVGRPKSDIDALEHGEEPPGRTSK